MYNIFQEIKELKDLGVSKTIIDECFKMPIDTLEIPTTKSGLKEYYKKYITHAPRALI